MFNGWVNILLYIAQSAICVVILHIYFLSFFPKRKSTFAWIAYLLYMAWQLFPLVGVNIPYINIIVGTVLDCLVAIVCFEGKIVQKIAFSVILSVIWSLSEFMVGFFLLALRIDYELYFWLGALISQIVLLLIIFFLYRFFRFYNIKNLPVKYNIMMLFLPVGSLFLTYKMFMHSVSLESEPALKEALVFLLVILFINFLSFRLYIYLADELTARKYNAVYTQQLEIYGREIQERQMSLEEYRSARHDMKQHFASLLSMLEEGRYETAEGYLKKLVADSQEAAQISRTGNLAVDAIINAKYSFMKIHGIECFTDIHIPAELPFEMVDITVLLGNVLDNAIEGSNTVSPEGGSAVKKYIKIYMAYDKNILIITIMNPYDGKLLRDKSGRILTRKSDKNAHGFGLASIQKIVEKYHGSMVIEDSPEEFVIKMMLMEDAAR